MALDLELGAESACRNTPRIISIRAPIRAACSSATIDLSQAQAQEPERVIQTAHLKDFIEVAFSADSRILVGAGKNWTKFWDVRTGKELRSLASGGHILFSRNGRVLAVSSQGRTELRDVHTGKVLHLLNGQAATFSPDDKMLATTAEKEITLWDVKTGRQRLTISI